MSSKPIRNKYRVSPAAQRTWNGRTYDSKAEMKYAQLLDVLHRSGEVVEWIEQPKTWLGIPENIYRPDFLVIPHDAMPYYVDVKGKETPAFKKNVRLWKKYGRLRLHVVKRKGDGWETKVIDPAPSARAEQETEV